MVSALQDRSRAVFGGLIAIELVLVLLISSPPWLMQSGHPVAATMVYAIFEPLCHQRTDRSFVIDGWSFAVCARCTGIYAGFVLGLVAYPFIRRIHEESAPPRIWLITALMIMGLDVIAGWTGVFPSTVLTRTATGLGTGAVAAFFVLPGLVSVFSSRARGAAESIVESGPILRTK